MVVACHGFWSVCSPCLMLQKKLKMKGSWKIAMIQAPHEDTAFRWRTGAEKA